MILDCWDSFLFDDNLNNPKRVFYFYFFNNKNFIFPTNIFYKIFFNY